MNKLNFGSKNDRKRKVFYYLNYRLQNKMKINKKVMLIKFNFLFSRTILRQFVFKRVIIIKYE